MAKESPSPNIPEGASKEIPVKSEQSRRERLEARADKILKMFSDAKYKYACITSPTEKKVGEVQRTVIFYKYEKDGDKQLEDEQLEDEQFEKDKNIKLKFAVKETDEDGKYKIVEN